MLRRDGERCGRRRIAQLMRQAGLAGRHRRRRHRTTIPNPQAATRPNPVLRDFRPNPAATNTRWCGDITYIPTEEGWLYLATVIDIVSRRVVDWATADHLRTELVADALRPACRSRRPTGAVVFHSDRGCRAVHQPRIRRCRPRVRCPSVGRPHRPVLAQRARRVLLRHHQARSARRSALAQPGSRPHRDL